MIDLKEVLLAKYQQKKLGHFYILKAPQQSVNKDEFLESWIKSFLTKVIASDHHISFQDAARKLELGHPDILILKKENQGEDYRMDNNELAPLFNFQNYRELELKWRFVIVLDAHLIGERYLNKLLKTLEEPQAHTSIMFCQTAQKGFLPTIESRAITLTIPEELKTKEEKTFAQAEDFFQYYLEDSPQLTKGEKQKVLRFIKGDLTPRDIADTFKKDRQKQRFLFDLILGHYLSLDGSYKLFQDLIHEVQWNEEASTYHNQYLERLFGLWSLHLAPQK